MKNVRSTQIDTLAEKEELAKFLKERLELLKAKEKETGILSPETRETVTALTTVLDKIRLETYGSIETGDELRDRAFGDWIKKKREGRM